MSENSLDAFIVEDPVNDIEDLSRFIVQEEEKQPEVVSQEPSFDSPYLKDRKFGEFVTGRSMPVEVEDLSEEDKVKADKAIKQIESNKVNENYLKSLNYLEVPGDNFKYIQPRATAPGIEETFLEGQYNNLAEQSSFSDGQINPSFQSSLDQWFQTDEGSAWWSENWYNNKNPYIIAKKGLKEDVGYETGSSIMQKVNLAGRVIGQQEGAATIKDQVSNAILTDQEGLFSPYIEKGISYGGDVNSSIALNKEIGKILSEQGVKAENIINPNDPSKLNRNYQVPTGVIERAKQNISLANAEAASKYQSPEVARAGYHQREIIKLSTNNPVLNPLNLGGLDNKKQIEFHKDEIKKIRKKYFSEQENGVPSQWYDPLSGSMVKKVEATSSQEEEEAQRIASAQEKWGDTNIETLYEQENKLSNEVIYLAKIANDNFSDIESDVSLFNVGRQINMAGGKYQKMLRNQSGSETLSPNLMYLPGSNVIATNFNKKLDELLMLQKAIDLNFKPTDLDVPEFRFFDYLSSETMKAFGKLSEDNEAVQKTNEALNFIELTKDTVGDEKTEELKEMWEPGMNKSSAVALIDGAKILTQFALTRKIAGKTPGMVKDGIKQLTTKIAGNSKVAQGFGNLISAIGEEAYVIELRNQAVRPIGEDPMSKLFALGAGAAGSMIKGAQNTLIKSQTYRNLLTTLNKSKLATNVVNGVAQPTLGTFNIIAGQVGERSILEDITMKEALKEATTFENFVNTFIMVGSAKAANPVTGLTRLYNAGVNDFYAYKGRINIEANKAAKVLGFEGKSFGKEDGALTNKEVNSRATSLRNKEGLNKPDLELTADQIKRKNNIRESVNSLKDQILYNETAKFIESTYGKNEYANIYTTGRMLASGQEPTTAMKRSIGNMSSVDQAYSIIADPNGPFAKNKRAQKDILNYVKNYKNFIDGIRRVGKTANDPKLESRLIEEFELLQNQVSKPLAMLEAMKKDLTGDELSVANEKIKSLKNKQQKFADNLNAELGENVTKRRQEIRGKVSDIISKQNVVKYEVLSNKDFLKRFGGEKGTEGLFVNDKGEMYVNEDYAKEINNVSVDSHELLHPAMNVTLNKLAKQGKLNSFISEFKSSLPANILAEARRIIESRSDITDKEFTREWFNVVSDVLQEGKINVVNTRSSMQKLANTFTEFFKTETPMKDVDFENGNDAYEFIKRYSKTFREGKTDAPLEEAVVSKLKRFETSEGTEKSSTPKVDEKTGNIFLDLTVKKNQVTLDDIIGERNKEGYYKMPKSKWKNSEAENLSIKLINGGSFDKLIGAKIFSQIKGQKRQNLLEDSKEELKKHVRAFDPQLNKNLFGYINSYLGLKVGTASKTKSIETSSLDQRQELMGREGVEIASSEMNAEDLADISLEKDRRAKSEEQKPKETTASKIGMPKEVKTPKGKVESNKYIEEIADRINYKDLPNITTEPGPNQTVSPFLSKLKSKIANDGNIKKDISQGMGKAKDRANYLETNFEKLSKNLDPGYFSGLIEREISKGKKVTLPKGLIQKDVGNGYTSDWYGKKAAKTKSAKTGITSGLKRIRLNPDFNFSNKANAKIFADAFKSQGRYEGLAGQIGAKAVIDLVEKSLGTGNKIDTKIKDIYEIQGRDLPTDYAKNFKDQILRAGIERSSTQKPKEIKIDLKDIKINFKAGEGFANSLKGIKEALSDLVIPKEIDSKGNVTDLDGQNRLRYFLENIMPKFLQTSKLINSANLSNRKNGAKMWLNSELREITEKAARITIEGDKGKLTAEALKELNKKIKALENSLGGSGLGGSTPTGFSGMKGTGKNFSKDNFIKRVDENYEGLDYFIDQTFEMINKHPEYLGEYLAFMKGASTSSTHFWRNFSMVIGKESNWNFDGLKGRGEHVLVSNEAAEFMTKSILKNLSTSKSPNKVIKTAKELLKENFFQILISVSNDGKVTKAGYQNSMIDGFWESWDKALETGNVNEAWSVWSRYFNSRVNKQVGPNGEAGFNPNEIKLYDRASGKQKSLADILEIGEEQFGKDVLNPEVIAEQQFLIEKWSTRQDGFKTTKELKDKMAIKLDMLNAKRNAALKSMNDMEAVNKDFKTPKKYTNKMVVDKAVTFDKALEIARSSTAPIKKIRIFDFDDTVGKSKSKILYETLEGKKGKLTPEQYAKEGERLLEEGVTFDFSEFNKVVEGKKGPLFDLMKKMNEAKGDRDVFILTARPAASELSIQKFLKELGIDIPLKNITGLENSSPFAKADWVVGKASEGYNDFYFADDAPQNVKAVKEGMSKLDVKSKVQLARENKINFSENKTKDLDWKTDEAGNIKTTFEIAGKKYNFNLDARDSKGSFDVEFNLDGRIDITGTGNAVKVIRTVYNGLLDAVSKNPKIKRLEFSSLKSEQSRVKLYTTLMDKVAKKLGWETDIWESNDFITPEKSSYDFEITKPRKKQIAPVEKVLDVIDVKSKTQIAKIERSSTMSQDFNKIIEESTGIGAEKVFSDVKAQVRGAKAKRQRFFIPPSAEDMLGLVYTTLGKGKKGEAHLKFYQENLFDPYTKAMENLSTDRVNLMADFKALKKQLDVPKDLRKTTESGFTNEQAVRVHLWNKMGEKIPGLSKSDLKELNDIVEKDPKLQAFADQILSITKGDGYSIPKENWAVGTITTDLIDVLNTKKRSKYLETWKQNKNLIYSKENLNKLEAAYGPKYRAALENSLRRMESGSNRLGGGNRLSNQVLDYINNSTGAIMFFNARSAVLQTISAANFINWRFNNPYKAGKAFANQPQYWKDFVELMNSDYLKDRRNGLKLNINESEIANAAKTSGNKAKAALNYILEKGYLPTKYADSFAIASGGATFYRNRINDLIKNEGKTEVEAKEIAMKEFRQVSEMSQQSSDPSKISQQQASDLGRVVLQFANTPMQYARIQKRAVQDIVNGRGDLKANISKIAYYGFLQNMLFNGLQQAVTSLGFGDEEMTDAEEKKLIKAANGMLDSSLRGLGMAGVTIQVLKNLGIDIYDRSKRDRPEYGDSYKKLLDFSPAIKSKLGKFQSAAYPFDSKKRRAEVFEKGFSLDNPAYESMAKVVTGTTNLPLDRLYSKVNNLSAAMDEETETWQSIAMILGWPEWQIKGRKNYVEAPKASKEQTKKDLEKKLGVRFL